MALLNNDEEKKMKKYSLKWWFATGKMWAEQDKKEGRTVRKAPGRKLIDKLAFKIGYAIN